jgi:hypothetical protein
MTGIEFLEPTDPSAPGGEPYRAGSGEPAPATVPSPAHVPTSAGRRAAGLWWLTAVLWSAAAVLALIAAYQPVLHVSYGGGPGSYAADAWGHFSGGGVVDAVRRGTRYGPVLCALGVVFAALAGYCVLRAQREVPAPVRAVATVVAMVASGFAAGLVVAMVLQVTSYLDGARATVHWQAGLGDPVRGDIDTAVGSSVAFATAALVCAMLAAAAGHPVVRSVVSHARFITPRERISPDLGG